MTTSFYNGISGLKSFQDGIDIWGNNISNINTVGFKENLPEFSTMFSNEINSNPVASDIGTGSRLSSSAINLSEGSMVNTDNPFDLAIDGKGWFAVDKNNQTYYTRNGAFKRDGEGTLVDDNGDRLLVANADNLIKNQDGTYYIDRNKNTQNLVNTAAAMTPIQLPNDVILPAVPTKNISMQTNLNDSSVISTTKPASNDSYFSALYDQNGTNMNITDGDSFVYEAGEETDYDKGLLSREICINSDPSDGKDVNIDFSVNNVNVKLTLPDGSTKEDIQNALNNYLQQPDIQQDLKNADVSYQINDGGIEFSSPKQLSVLSNSDFTKSSEAKTLVYKNTPQTSDEFATVDDLTKQIQSVLNDVYPDKTKVELESDGKIAVYNSSKDTKINSAILKTDSTNDLFYNNIDTLGNVILPQTAAKSSPFLVNSQSFGGDLYDINGNKDTLSLTFDKKEVLSSSTIWEGNITIKNPEGSVLYNTAQNFTFDSQGTLLTPKTINIDKPQKITLKLNVTSYTKTDTSPTYSYNQDGISQGYLDKYQINKNGEIQAMFSNGQMSVLGQIPVYHFQNSQGLESIGSDLYRQTDNSNKAVLFKDKTGNYIPTSVSSNTLEESNVNFSQAMTELIVIQKAYSSAAKTVTTSDQMIQKAINMVKG